ncbi:MAG: extracellular solute-binding protein [Phycisphaerae bacterium]|nr:extracellular solute-binding protein [Phycisphaerae bacterium]
MRRAVIRKTAPLILSTTLVAAAIVVLFGCTRRDSAADASGKITITVWDWHAADPSKGVGLWLMNIDREFERLHPNVRIKHDAQSHTEYYQIFKAAAAARRGPDVVMLHQGARVLDQRDSLIPLDKYVTPEFRKQLVGWALSCENYDPNGTPWAVPIAVQGLIWYANKALLRQAGLDPKKLPKTWDEFLAACAAVKKLGKAGIAAGQREGSWGEWFVNDAHYQTLSAADKDRLLRGEIKWTDPKVTLILEKIKQLNDNGCFQKGMMSTPLFPDAGEVFMRGDAAFFLGLLSDVAHWKEFGEILGAENIGVMTCPIFKPGPDADKFPVGGGFAYGITQWAQHPDEAWQYITFIASAENAKTFMTDVGSFPANQGYDRGRVTDPSAKQIDAWIEAGRGEPDLLSRASTEVNDSLRREVQRLLSDQTDVAGAAAAIEKTAAAERARGAVAK